MCQTGQGKKKCTSWMLRMMVLGAFWVMSLDPLGAADWLHYGCDNQQTSWNPVEDTVGPLNVADLERVWGVGCDDSWYSVAFRSPAIYFGRVYYSSAGAGMSAFDAQTGELVWRASAGSSTWSPQPVVGEDGTVYLLDGGYPCGLFAYDGVTGSQKWEAPIAFDMGIGDVAESRVTVDDARGVVYVIEEPFGMGEGKLFALSKASGEILWYKSEATDGYAFEGDYVVLDGGKILVESQVEESYLRLDKMLRIDATTHAVDRVFERPVSTDLADISKFCLCGRSLAVVYCDRDDVFESEGALVVYDVDSGRVLWQKIFANGVTGHVACNPELGILYVPTEPYLYALSATTGSQVWRYAGYDAILSPSVANGVVYFLSDTNMYALDEQSGTRLFSFPLGEQAEESTQVAICDGQLYFSGNGGTCDLFVLGLPQAPISVAPGSFDFGDLGVGQVATQVFSVTNDSDVAQSIGLVQITGQDAASFSLGADECSGQVLAAHASASIAVRFAPTREGSHGAELRLPFGDGQAVHVNLRGFGTQGAAYAYTLPYFVADATHWSGIALRNAAAAATAHVTATAYDQQGTVVVVEQKTLPARGQDAFVMGAGLAVEGWVMVTSDQPLIGLDFFGTSGSHDHMADITLIPNLSTRLIVPHVAQNDQWDTTVMVCNPHDHMNSVRLTYFDGSGNQILETQHAVPRMGSRAVELAEELSGRIPFRGSVEISGDLGVSAFALYRNLKWGGGSFAGISAVDPTIQ